VLTSTLIPSPSSTETATSPAGANRRRLPQSAASEAFGRSVMNM